MNEPRKTSGSELFIVDNSDKDWKVSRYLRDWCRLSSSIDIATGNFEIGALLELDGDWQKVDQFRLLMGDDVTRCCIAHSIGDGLFGTKTWLSIAASG